jgi:hypothetical protein
MRAHHHPVSALEAEYLDRPEDGIDEPEVGDTLAGIDLHLPAAVDRARRRREHLTSPVRSQLEGGDVGHGRHALAPPAGKVGNQDLVAEVQLGLIEDPPAPRNTRGVRRTAEGSDEREADHRQRERIGRGRPRASDQLAVDESRPPCA